MPLLLNFEQRLLYIGNFNIVGSGKILKHVGLLLTVTLIKIVALGAHIPLDPMYLVCSVGSIPCHHYTALKFPIHSLVVIALEAVINEVNAVIDGEELRDVVDNKI